MKELIVAALLGGLVFFIWSAISWMALPWQRLVYKRFANEDAVAQFITDQARGSGLYGLPGEPVYPPGASKEERQSIDQSIWSRLQRGPTITAVIKFGGMPSFPRMLITAFVTYVLVAFLFSYLLSVTGHLSYGQRVLFVTLIGLGAGIICRVPDWNWHQYPLDHTVVQIGSLTVGWFLSGLVIARFVQGIV